MGRSAKGSRVLEGQAPLFDPSQLPSFAVTPDRRRMGLQHPLWTEKKAQLIQEYMRLFVFVTRHGTYIDGFAAPQRRNRSDLCSAELVLRNEPRWIRKLWLCDLDDDGISKLHAIAEAHKEKGRKIHVVQGDFNETVADVLAKAGIKEKTATFALLDQRTFECSWATVQRLAQHKAERKIEIFYFLATGWLERAMVASRRPSTLQLIERWWGGPDWAALRSMSGLDRAQLVAKRFRDELGYTFAKPYAIHDRLHGGRTMYHMIHATDHPDASALMIRAYRKTSGRKDIDVLNEQVDLETLWRESQEELAEGRVSDPTG